MKEFTRVINTTILKKLCLTIGLNMAGELLAIFRHISECEEKHVKNLAWARAHFRAYSVTRSKSGIVLCHNCICRHLSGGCVPSYPELVTS